MNLLIVKIHLWGINHLIFDFMIIWKQLLYVHVSLFMLLFKNMLKYLKFHHIITYFIIHKLS